MSQIAIDALTPIVHSDANIALIGTWTIMGIMIVFLVLIQVSEGLGFIPPVKRIYIIIAVFFIVSIIRLIRFNNLSLKDYSDINLKQTEKYELLDSSYMTEQNGDIRIRTTGKDLVFHSFNCDCEDVETTTPIAIIVEKEDGPTHAILKSFDVKVHPHLPMYSSAEFEVVEISLLH